MKSLTKFFLFVPVMFMSLTACGAKLDESAALERANSYSVSEVETNYKSREFRKIQINVYNTNRLKLLLYENYQNSFNKFNQVGIVSLEFYGNIEKKEIYKVNIAVGIILIIIPENKTS